MAKSKSLRSQYAEESAYIRKRLKVLEEKVPDSYIVRTYKNEFPKLKDLGPRTSDRAFEMALKKMRTLKEAGAFSVREQKQYVGQAITTLHERGYEFVNKENFADLFKFLDDARARGLATIFGYEKILEAVHTARRKKLTDEEIMANMDFWAKHANDKNYKELTVRRRPKGSNSADISRSVRRKKR